MTKYSNLCSSCFEHCSNNYKFKYIDKVKIDVEELTEVFLVIHIHKNFEKLYQNLKYLKYNSICNFTIYLHDTYSKNQDNSTIIFKKVYWPKQFLKELYYFCSLTKKLSRIILTGISIDCRRYYKGILILKDILVEIL